MNTSPVSNILGGNFDDKKNKLQWKGTLEDLKAFVLTEIDEETAASNNWRSPGGGSWNFESQALTVAWQTKSQNIYFGGEKGSDLTQRVRKFLYDRNGASKNTSYTALDESLLHEEDQHITSHSDHEKQGEVVIHSAGVNRDKPSMEPKCIYSKQLNPSRDIDDSFNYNSDISALNSKLERFTESVTNKLEDLAIEINNIKENKPYSILILENTVNDLKQEKFELNKKIDELKEPNMVLSHTVSDLRLDNKNLENDKASLLTALKLIQDDCARLTKASVDDKSNNSEQSKFNEANDCIPSRQDELNSNIQSVNKFSALEDQAIGASTKTVHQDQTRVKQKRKFKAKNKESINESNKNSIDDQLRIQLDLQQDDQQNHDRVLNPDVPAHNRFSPLRVELDDPNVCGMDSLIEVPTDANLNQNDRRRKESHSGSKSNIVIVGDSMIKNIDPRKLSRKQVNKFSFPGRRAEEIASEIRNINTQLQPTHVIMHAGTNNLPSDTSDQCIKNIKGLCSKVKDKFPQAKLGISSIILRKDIEATSKMHQVNDGLKRLCNDSGYVFIDNSSIDESGLNNSKLHLNAKGSAFLASRFIKFLNPDKQYNKQSGGNRSSSENFLRDFLNLVALT